MSNGVIPQLFAIWRTSVLFTVGAISLGAERLESSLHGWTTQREKVGAPRVKVPVHRAQPVARKPVQRTERKAGARKVRVKAAAKGASPAEIALVQAFRNEQGAK